MCELTKRRARSCRGGPEDDSPRARTPARNPDGLDAPTAAAPLRPADATKYPKLVGLIDSAKSRLYLHLVDLHDQDVFAHLTARAALELRGFALWRKSSLGSQSARGESFAANLESVIHTCRKQRRHVFSYLVEALQATFSHGSASSLLPAR